MTAAAANDLHFPDESKPSGMPATGGLSLWRGAIPAKPPFLRQCKSEAAAIVQQVSEAHEVSVAAIFGQSRKAPIAQARRHAMHALYATRRYSLPEIGRFLGGRHHTTVLHGIREHAKRMGRPH